MIQNKKSIVVYSNWITFLKDMTMEERGQLFTALMLVANGRGEDMELNTPCQQMAFDFMRAQIASDTEKWNKAKEKRSRAGRAGMKSRWQDDG